MTERLLACLESHANNRGIVLAAEEALLRELGADRDAVSAELERLERASLVELLAPLPFLVLRLKKWSGHREKAAESRPSAYSYPKQLLHKQQLKESYRPDDQAPATTATLLRELLDTLGETDAGSFEKAVELYSPHVIRTALDRVRRARDIRKSRTALFRHLLPRLARESQHGA